jgi:hypothetical protein
MDVLIVPEDLFDVRGCIEMHIKGYLTTTRSWIRKMNLRLALLSSFAGI